MIHLDKVPVCEHTQLLSHVQLFATLWTIARQAPLSMGFSRQEYWSGWPFPSPGSLPDPGIEPSSPALQADSLPSPYEVPRLFESPLDCKEIQPVHPRGNQSWMFTRRTDVEAETPTLWPPDKKNWLIWKDPDAGKDWRWEEKGTTEDEIVGWHHRLNRHEFVWTPGVGDGQGGLTCCSLWGPKESDTTERLNWTELNRTKRSHIPRAL